MRLLLLLCIIILRICSQDQFSNKYSIGMLQLITYYLCVWCFYIFPNTVESRNLDDGVMTSVLASGAVDNGFEPRSSQAK
jgi:hypothetical protein